MNQRAELAPIENSDAPNALIDSIRAVLPLNLAEGVIVMDFGNVTCDGVQVGERQWEVSGSGYELMVAQMAAQAEREKRKVSFLPLRVVNKAVRSAMISIKANGNCTFSNGATLTRRT